MVSPHQQFSLRWNPLAAPQDFGSEEDEGRIENEAKSIFLVL
jgi:hypothetical protein